MGFMNIFLNTYIDTYYLSSMYLYLLGISIRTPVYSSFMLIKKGKCEMIENQNSGMIQWSLNVNIEIQENKIKNQELKAEDLLKGFMIFIADFFYSPFSLHFCFLLYIQIFAYFFSGLHWIFA